MNVLVTGGLGHIGSKLIREYSKRKEISLIRIMDNMLTQRYASLFNLPERKGLKYEFFEGDITEKKDLERGLQNIDVVIHLAAITDAPSTIGNRTETERVNFLGTKKIVEGAMKKNVKKFLFPSTTSVYGESEGLVDENSPDERYKPASPYAESKRKTELYLEKIGKEQGFNITVLRMGTIFGTSPGMRFHTAINKFCYLAALGKPLTVWDSALESKRPYLGLYDDIRAFAFLEKYGKAGEIYNVVTANYEMGEIIETIREFVPYTEIQITKSPLLNQKPYEVGSDKIRNLGFDFKDSLRGGIKATLDLLKGVKNKI